MAHLQDKLAIGKGDDDPNAALLSGAPSVRGRADEPRLPARMPISGTHTRVCAAYQAECIVGSKPMRANLLLAHGRGGLGLGVPDDSSANASNLGWKMRALDFCNRPPREVKWLPRGQDIPKRRRRGIPSAADCFCGTQSLFPRFEDPLGFGRRVPAGALPHVPPATAAAYTCGNDRSFITFQCSDFLLLAPPQEKGPHEASVANTIEILMATCDHFGHGLFAIVQRVLNQVHLARRLRLEPFVFVGERSFAEPQACEYGRSAYFDSSLGSNIWDYWFKQPGDYRLGARTVRGMRVSSLQVAAVDLADRSGPIRAYSSPHYYNKAERRAIRLSAHQFLGDGGVKLVRRAIREKAKSIFETWRLRSRHVIGAHLRGTDKVVQPKVPPEAYFPFVDAYFAAHDDAMIFVATDDEAYLERMRRRYSRTGRLVSAVPRVLERAASSRGGRGDRAQIAYRKGESVLLDALLLSQARLHLAPRSMGEGLVDMYFSYAQLL